MDDPARATAVLRDVTGVLGVHPGEPADHRLIVELDGIPRADIVRALVLAEVAVETVMPRRRLEDAYLSLVEHDR